MIFLLLGLRLSAPTFSLEVLALPTGENLLWKLWKVKPVPGWAILLRLENDDLLPLFGLNHLDIAKRSIHKAYGSLTLGWGGITHGSSCLGFSCLSRWSLYNVLDASGQSEASNQPSRLLADNADSRLVADSSEYVTVVIEDRRPKVQCVCRGVDKYSFSLKDALRSIITLSADPLPACLHHISAWDSNGWDRGCLFKTFVPSCRLESFQSPNYHIHRTWDIASCIVCYELPILTLR